MALAYDPEARLASHLLHSVSYWQPNCQPSARLHGSPPSRYIFRDTAQFRNDKNDWYVRETYTLLQNRNLSSSRYKPLWRRGPGISPKHPWLPFLLYSAVFKTFNKQKHCLYVGNVHTARYITSHLSCYLSYTTTTSLLLKRFSLQYIPTDSGSGHHVKCPLLVSDFNQKWNTRKQILLNLPNIRFHEKPYCCSTTEDSGLLVCDAVWLGSCFPTFRKNPATKRHIRPETSTTPLWKPHISVF